MTPLIDAARTLLELLDEHNLPPWRTVAAREGWKEAVEALRAAIAPAETDATHLVAMEDAAEIRYMTSGEGETR